MQASEHDQVETQLLAFVRKLERNYYDWRVVHLHLSGLKPRNRRDYHLRIAAREFDGLVRKFKSELFQVSNGDIFFIWHGGTYADVDPVVLRLRYLFSDDPLANANDTALTENAELLVSLDLGEFPQALPAFGSGFVQPPKFCSWFDLEREYEAFAFTSTNTWRASDQAAPTSAARGGSRSTRRASRAWRRASRTWTCRT